MLQVNHLDGFGVGVDVEEPIEIAFVGSSTSTSAAITLPSGLEDGDIGVLFQMSVGISTPPTRVTPSGFTPGPTTTTTSISALRSSIEYKILTESDAGATITGTAGSAARKIFAVFRPSSPLSALAESASDSSGGASGSGASASLTLTTEFTQPLLILGSTGSNVNNPTLGGTVITNGTQIGVSSNTLVASYEFMNQPSSNRNLTIANSGSATAIGLALRCLK